MRPTRLLVSGFTAFRDPTELDFTDADLFAFTGPTGSGKSSLVDAMVFALYGCVPRLDPRAVAPIISLGRTEARVQLDFTVDGEAYTAVRVVRRTKAGASTKEARLERAGGDVLAGNEKELTAHVERLLGLGYDHFTTCVVLPQGKFARFLQAGDKDRQKLLVSLLDLGLYQRMARRANERDQVARNAAGVVQGVLDTLAFATPEALAEAGKRLERLRALRSDVDTVAPEVEALCSEEVSAIAEAGQAQREADLLSTVIAPTGVGRHGHARATAQEALASADAEAERVTVVAEAAEKALAALPSRVALEKVRDAHEQLALLEADRLKGEGALRQRSEEASHAAVSLAAAEVVATATAENLERTRWEHRAHDLAASLVTGQPCPVCRQVVSVLPGGDELPDPDGAGVAKGKADDAVVDARRASDDAERHRTRVGMKLESIAGRFDELAEIVAMHSDRDQVDFAIVGLDDAESAEQAARQASRTAQRALGAARQAVEAQNRAEAEARRAFEDVRDRVAALGPPTAGRLDLAADWTALAAWAAVESPARKERADIAMARATAAASRRAELQSGLTERCQEAGISVPTSGDVRSAVADAVATASAAHERIEQGLVEGSALRADVITHTRTADVARELGRLLSVRHFEKWVLDETLAGLVSDAAVLLCELSDGAYSLALDERSAFTVIDHRNADEVRSARTLSGGETFLASLALALALADQIGSLAAGGSARLESIFLDEGFGSLDPDTLDTVASAIEELGARGRMVGLISHVAELAERVPVRFEVTKGPAGATVTRVTA